MSSFIVEDATINRIVTHLYEDRNAENGRRELSTLGIATRPQDLGEEMYRMNLAAVEDRYGDFAAGTMGALSGADYTYKRTQSDPVQTLKSLRCYLYQCSEGEVPNSPLFKLLDRYAGEIALDIVRETPEWEAANWG